jgi:chromosome segregation ATPase
MAAGDVTNELMYELMKSMNARLGRMEDRLDRIEGELKVVRAHVGALVQSDLLKGGDLASLSLRVERIERRLDLHDPNI